MEFTDKTQRTLAEATQLAKDYAHVQSMSLPSPLTCKNLLVFPVYPVHLAFVLLNGGTSDSEPSVPGGPTSNASPGLFASVVARAGGDPVSTPYPDSIRRFDQFSRYQSNEEYISFWSDYRVKLHHQMIRLSLMLV